MCSENSAPVALPQLHHVGVVVEDLAETMRVLTAAFGIGPWEVREREYQQEHVQVGTGPFRFAVAFARLGPIELELIQVREGQTVHRRFLEEHGPGLHHLGFRVPDMAQMAAQCQQHGIQVLQSAKRADGGHTYMNCSLTGGIIFEFAYRPQPSADA